ncbi:MAG: phosphoenolpyruvate--protein phosphotransferase [Puniceicoccales bacterium]|jgi:phosphotransferase system enzyme I (PtsI)|nr:phosphoenolpyruvate--protein phosphotransferase [Puniceicoccales bacterium]
MNNVRDEKEIRIQGIPAAPGVARGAAFVFFAEGLQVPCYSIAESSLENERQRFLDALVATRKQLVVLRDKVARDLGEKEAGIFDAHLLVLDDPAFISEPIQLMLQRRTNIECNFHHVAEKYIECFSSLEDDYLKERVGDVRDVAQRVLYNLLGLSQRTLSEVTDKRVIVAEDLSPSDTASMEKGHALAIVTDSGNRTSHAVIMSRSLRIPAVVGLMSATKKIAAGDDVLVDGHEGIVFVNPSEKTLWRYGHIEKMRTAFAHRVQAEVALSNSTSDGKPFKLSANVNGIEDMEGVHKYHAQGVGLFRTEGIFLKDPHHLPDEEAQYAFYSDVVTAARPHRVIVRTLDIGGDKPHDTLLSGGVAEANPFMGFRAIRYCLERKDVFRTQLRAILRASIHGRVKVMFPMISSLDELLQARDFFDKVCAELKQNSIPFDENIPIGSMIEIPSAAYSAQLLAAHCDFFSIGTNDLVQYMLAVDRGNSRIAHLYDPCNPAVLGILRHVIGSAKDKHIEVSVCGELAGDTMFAPLLIALGADSLSMTPTAIPEVRYLLRHSDATALNKLVNEAYAEQDPQKTSQILREYAQSRLTI